MRGLCEQNSSECRYFELDGEPFVYDEGALKIFRMCSKEWFEVSMRDPLLKDLQRGRRISREEALAMASGS